MPSGAIVLHMCHHAGGRHRTSLLMVVMIVPDGHPGPGFGTVVVLSRPSQSVMCIMTLALGTSREEGLHGTRTVTILRDGLKRPPPPEGVCPSRTQLRSTRGARCRAQGVASAELAAVGVVGADR
jgi:hypothetical protein